MNTIQIWGLILGGATLLAVTWVLVLQYENRQVLKNLEVDTVLDAIDGVRDSIDHGDRNTRLEHEALHAGLAKANGRLQFLVAKDISAELSAAVERDRARRASSFGPPSPPESTPRTGPDIAV